MRVVQLLPSLCKRCVAAAGGQKPFGTAAVGAQTTAAGRDHGWPIRAALVRGLPSTFANSLKMEEPGQPIDMALAHQQHDAYTRLLRQLVGYRLHVRAKGLHDDQHLAYAMCQASVQSVCVQLHKLRQRGVWAVDLTHGNSPSAQPSTTLPLKQVPCVVEVGADHSLPDCVFIEVSFVETVHELFSERLS